MCVTVYMNVCMCLCTKFWCNKDFGIHIHMHTCTHYDMCMYMCIQCVRVFGLWSCVEDGSVNLIEYRV